MRHISLRYRAGLASAAITLAMAAAPAAQAVPVTLWEVTVDAVFADVMPVGVTVSDDKSLSWGTGSSGPSSLTISNTPIVTQVETNGSGVANVSLTHTNNPINTGGAHLTNVNLLWTLTLTPLLPNPGSPLDMMNHVFSLSFIETPNADSPCADGTSPPGPGNVHANGCADIFVFGSTALNMPFSYDGEDYFLSFTEFTSGLQGLSDEACTATGSPINCIGFQTAENMATTIRFAAWITTEPVSVPEPATLGLFGLALAGMAGVMRRRKARA